MKYEEDSDGYGDSHDEYYGYDDSEYEESEYEYSDDDDEEEPEVEWADGTPPIQIDTTNLRFDVRSVFESLIREGLRCLDFASYTQENRFIAIIHPLLGYVLPRYRSRYSGPLWDPLPRQIVDVDDTVLKCVMLHVFIDICEADHYAGCVGQPINPYQREYLHTIHFRVLHMLSGPQNAEDLRVALIGSIPCTLRLTDFFSPRHRSDVPINSIIRWTDENGRRYLEETTDNLAVCFNKENIMDAGHEAGLVGHHFKQPMFEDRDQLASVVIRQAARVNRVTLKYRDGRQLSASFLYEAERKESEENFEPSLFDLADG
jgi:hypothetical protein